MARRSVGVAKANLYSYKCPICEIEGGDHAQNCEANYTKDSQMKFLENQARQITDDETRTVVTILLARVDYLERLVSELHYNPKLKREQSK